MLSRIREMVSWGTWDGDFSRGAWWSHGGDSLRSFFRRARFFRRSPQDVPTIDLDRARVLYRNEDSAVRYGGFFRPVIDATVEFMGLPTVSGLDGGSEALLNECVRDYWAPQLQQALRDAMRDSRTVVRFGQPRIDNPLFSEQDRAHGFVEVVPPELVDLTYDVVDKNLLTRAIVTHFVKVDERTPQEVQQGQLPREVEHEVLETITAASFSFYDKTKGAPLTTWDVRNTLGFVPLWEVYNEYSADLGGGQSDIEAVYAFVLAFSDVLSQALDAHKYHSTPMAKFTVKSVENFIANNWPEAVDPETKKVVNGAKINWEGNEILFFAPDEDGDFIQAESVLGDSKSLLDFLIDCVAVAAEVPRWVLFADDVATKSSASLVRFKKRVERKRTQFNELFVMLSKMALAASGRVPDTPRVNWDPVEIDDLAARGQALQQLMLAFDVAAAHQWMADVTIVKMLASFFPEMNAPEVERALAADNVEAVAPAPASSTQALPPPSTGVTANGNGSKDDAARVVRQLTTTTASRS